MSNLEKLRTLPEEDLARFLDEELTYSTPVDWKVWLREEVTP